MMSVLSSAGRTQTAAGLDGRQWASDNRLHSRLVSVGEHRAGV